MSDQLITLAEAARLVPKVRGQYRSWTTINQWCERADIIAVWNPKQVWKSEFLAWARQAGKLPAQPIQLVAG